MCVVYGHVHCNPYVISGGFYGSAFTTMYVV